MFINNERTKLIIDVGFKLKQLVLPEIENVEYYFGNLLLENRAIEFENFGENENQIDLMMVNNVET